MAAKKPTGLSKDAGYMVGARKTFPVSKDAAWDFLFSDEGLRTWLGKISADDIEPGKSFKTKEGIEGTITTFVPGSHFRMKWKRKDWPNEVILQVRVIPANEKTTISFMQEKLVSAKQRAEMKKHWTEVLEQMENKIA